VYERWLAGTKQNLVRLEITKGWNHFRAEETDRPHEIFFADGTDVELAQDCVEYAFRSSGSDLLDDCLR
jgi:hypothetical protein